MTRLDDEADRMLAGERGTVELRGLVRHFTAAELQTAPDPRAFAWAPWIPAARVSVLVGAGGTSKSSLAVRLAVATILGEPLFGGETTPAGVLFVSAEDRRADLHRHLFEAMRGRTEAEAGIVGRHFHPMDCNGLDVKLVRLIDRAAVVTQQAQELAEVARGADAGLVILDTCSRLNGAGEDNEGLARMIEAGELIAREADAAVVILHHTGKQQMRDSQADQYGGRGGSAMSDNARSVLHLAVATEPRKTPVADADRLVPAREVLVLSHVKSNYATPALPVYLHRQKGAYAARLVQLPVVANTSGPEAVWADLARWLAAQTEVRYPTRRTVDGLEEIGTRASRRRALEYALDRGLLRELPRPDATGNAKTFLALAGDA